MTSYLPYLRPTFVLSKGPVPKRCISQQPEPKLSVPQPLEWILNPNKAATLAARIDLFELTNLSAVYDRILARLTQSEAHELDPHLRDDYRIAWLTVRFCQTGEAESCAPHVLATYKVLGVHPDQVWKRMVATRRANLGSDYSRWYGTKEAA